MKKLRFAPSPTGYLHIGGARTALYNYLLAKKWNGKFILRIEDTDRVRSTPESVQAILDSLAWLGLEWDEGPYYQTERSPLYKEHIDRLLKEAKAYRCFCPPEMLEGKRALAQKEKRKPMYDRTCLGLSAVEVQKRLTSGSPHCIRFRSPDEGNIVVKDVIKGEVVVANKELDDLVIQRTDGSPTYNLTVVVDDATMKITHVVRGEDHLNNTPRQIQLYQALGYTLPVFAHVPLILGTDKKRLSKRHGATSVMAYRDMGYLTEALLNYLARLGWAYGDEEVFSMEELISKFSLEGVSKSAGVFNPDKLLWLNGIYLRQTQPERLRELMTPLMKKIVGGPVDPGMLLEGIKVSQEKIKTLEEMTTMLDFFFTNIEPEAGLVEKYLNSLYKPVLTKVIDGLEDLSQWDHASIEKVFTDLVAQTGLGLGKIAQPIRVALTGRTISPGIYEIIRILGKQATLERLKRFL